MESLKKIELSIIIVNYNTKDLTINCLRSIILSLKLSPVNYEMIVIDNASADSSVSQLKKLTSKYSVIRIVENKTNDGFAKANNQGIKQAKGKFILLLNSDIIVIDDAVPKLLSYYKTQPLVNFLGGKLFNKDGSPQPSAGPFYSLPVVFAALFLRGDYWQLTRYSPARPREVDWVSGACILAKKADFEKISGFDENIFMYMDEIDLLFRAKKQGLRTIFYPEAKFTHLGSASSQGRTYPILQVYRGFLYFYRKHHPAAAVFFLKIMLKLKAGIALTIGKVTNNHYLVKTYEEAWQLVDKT